MCCRINGGHPFSNVRSVRTVKMRQTMTRRGLFLETGLAVTMVVRRKARRRRAFLELRRGRRKVTLVFMQMRSVVNRYHGNVPRR